MKSTCTVNFSLFKGI